MQLQVAAALQRALAGALPEALAAHCRVLHCENGVAVVEAAHSAAAARLRLLRPRLVRALNKADSAVREIRIVVDVARQSPGQARVGRRLSATAMTAWRQLEGSLPDGPLREACRGMLSRPEISDRQQQTLEEEERQDRGGHE